VIINLTMSDEEMELMEVDDLLVVKVEPEAVRSLRVSPRKKVKVSSEHRS
jgi:hypothetical protein